MIERIFDNRIVAMSLSCFLVSCATEVSIELRSTHIVSVHVSEITRIKTDQDSYVDAVRYHFLADRDVFSWFEKHKPSDHYFRVFDCLAGSGQEELGEWPRDILALIGVLPDSEEFDGFSVTIEANDIKSLLSEGRQLCGHISETNFTGVASLKSNNVELGELKVSDASAR